MSNLECRFSPPLFVEKFSILTLPGNRGKGDRLARQVWVHEQRPDGGEDFLAQVFLTTLNEKGTSLLIFSSTISKLNLLDWTNM